MSLTYKSATVKDVETVFRFNKEPLEQYEDLSGIDYEAILYCVVELKNRVYLMRKENRNESFRDY